jgi:hypothetical protein
MQAFRTSDVPLPAGPEAATLDRLEGLDATALEERG